MLSLKYRLCRRRNRTWLYNIIVVICGLFSLNVQFFNLAIAFEARVTPLTRKASDDNMTPALARLGPMMASMDTRWDTVSQIQMEMVAHWW